MTDWEKEFDERLEDYFTGLVHYQYDINNGYDGAVKAKENQQKYLNNKLKKYIKDLLKEEREKARRAFLKKIKENIDTSIDHCACGVISYLKQLQEQE